ncbi:D-alanyl-D-alanine carboxypeptidase/D-alanyl-D-alanine-endopeptidase [Roseibacillus ishigakijimensis]|uniref:D-alanyl-D-alanine carboxypeptidase/D-alanyl-D-alanine-endopeptidase n=1 Tax=Roseibacillus ishigakijimensis TaxID=454146 RepID=A0A934RPX9_9BACT|nr:D-alanyl-D-alanine carboxypeptidase/D-alanyl-D-alanine-endopeptidase [Roseibacillus ishigakijimensis]MBK1834803.1 D-alanyl-D-alanine carboxypeptidase/D-alanyl-D-alanine-endopeptidase [Roseibacillus ishigakijimensis]
MKAALFLTLGSTLALGAAPLEEFLQDPVCKTASVGFALLPLAGFAPLPDSPSGAQEEGSPAATSPRAQPLFHQPDLALTPASVQKAVTTATALQILGPDYRFRTRLFRQGEDLIILGGGDPLLAASGINAEFSAWRDALQTHEIDAIPGKIIADPSFFEDQCTPNQWLWGDIGNYYGAGACGLNFHRNSFTLTFRPGEVGSEARLISAYPRPPGVTFENHMRTGPSGSGDQGYAYSGPRRTLITLRGTVPAGNSFSIQGALPNPPLSCATAFRDFLEKSGLPVGGVEVRRETNPAAEDLLHTTESPPLSRILLPVNMRSVNLYAECLYKALADDGTHKSAQQKLRTHWQKQGVDMDGFLAHDGSGLSPQNTLTARQVAHILALTFHSEHASVFRASLPAAGRSGTLRSFATGTAAEGRLLAKSGAMERVRTWAGYLRTMAGEGYAFALLVNHYHGSDRAVTTAAEELLSKLCAQGTPEPDE